MRLTNTMTPQELRLTPAGLETMGNRMAVQALGVRVGKLLGHACALSQLADDMLSGAVQTDQLLHGLQLAMKEKTTTAKKKVKR